MRVAWCVRRCGIRIDSEDLPCCRLGVVQCAHAATPSALSCMLLHASKLMYSAHECAVATKRDGAATWSRSRRVVDDRFSSVHQTDKVVERDTHATVAAFLKRNKNDRLTCARPETQDSRDSRDEAATGDLNMHLVKIAALCVYRQAVVDAQIIVKCVSPRERAKHM